MVLQLLEFEVLLLQLLQETGSLLYFSLDHVVLLFDVSLELRLFEQ